MSEYLIIQHEQFCGSLSGIKLPLDKSLEYYFFKNRGMQKCFGIYPTENGHSVQLSYFIGADWISEGEQAIYVEPKISGASSKTDYLKMLFSALKHSEISNFTNELFEIKWGSKLIEINQQQDLLTPLLVVQFLRIVQRIVRKGLKKSYYKVEHNLNGKVKGKVLVSKSIKQNLVKNKLLYTYCSYDEFGVNGLENRLLKKALVFVLRYLPSMKNLNCDTYTENVFRFINPAFESVSEEVSLFDVKFTKTNVFYKEYDEAIKLAKLILKRFGYNITNIDKETISTPPFWIDMSKLFELYLLGYLKDKYGSDVHYQFNANYGNPDYLLNNDRIVADAKYKTYYNEPLRGQAQWKRDSIASDVRQLSGYSRDKAILYEFGISEEESLKFVPECLIFYPDQTTSEDLFENEKKEIIEFSNIYKQPIRLPTIE